MQENARQRGINKNFSETRHRANTNSVHRDKKRGVHCFTSGGRGGKKWFTDCSKLIELHLRFSHHVSSLKQSSYEWSLQFGTTRTNGNVESLGENVQLKFVSI